MAKRGYKLQEFVAHSGNVNCLRFGKKTRRQFLTGGDDQIVNLWSIGKPTFTARLSGHTSPVESVAFDSGEVLVVAGASSGLIKLWDLQETKVVRTLTGHRSYCTALEFHPFGEFFASGSMDTNLKIWDIRKKGCIHTYKGHSRAISTIRFTPDGRWVVSGGFDNVVKVWDLTAGKLLHDFKFHEGHIRSIDFHPLEFLLATGSADRTVNFWDLETFELIGSSKREAAGVRSMTFHPDGRTLFCGLDNNLKVYSWEPVLCHDSVEMGWSTLSDLCISDGKLVGGAYYQNTIGVWVADISQIEPYGTGLTPEKQHNTEQKQECRLERVGSNRSLKTECLLERVASDRSSNSSLRCTSPDIDSKDIKNIYVDSENPVTIKKVTCHMPKAVPASDSIESNKQSSQKINSFVDLPAKPNGLLVDKSQKPSHIKRLSSNNFDMEKISVTLESESAGSLPTQVDCKKESNIDNRLMIDNNSREYSKAKDSDVEHGGEKLEKTSLDDQENRKKASEGRKELHPVRVVNGVAVVRGRTRSLVERFEKREGLNIDDVHKLDSKTEQAEVSASPPSSCKDEEPEMATSYFKAKEATLPLPPAVDEANTCASPCKGEEPEMATSHFKAKEATLPLPPAVDEANTCASPCNIEELEASHTPASSPCYVEELEASHMPASQFKSEQVEVSCSEAEEVAASPLPVSQVKSMDGRKSRLPASRSKAGELEASPIPVSQVKHENVRRSRLPYSRSKTEELEAPVSQFKSGARTSRMSVFRSKAEQAKTSRLLASRSKAEEPQTIRCLTSSSNAQEPQTFRCLSVSSNAEEPQTAPLLNTDERALPRCESVQNDNIVFEDLMQNHDVLLSTFRSRLTKLQVVRHFWERNDIKGAINALRKLPDLSVQADVVSVLVDKMDIITLDLFSCLLPILLSLLDSKVERHVNVSVELLMKLVAVFGPVVRSAVSAPPSVGVDLHAEERIKCCRQCFAHLQDMQKILPALIRRGGLLAKGALQLNLLLQES